MHSAALRRLWLGLVPTALVLKAVYLTQYVALPFLYGPLFDSPVYLQQAAAVREGRHGDPTLVAFSPLYGYFLAAVDAPHRHGLVIVTQLLLGVLNLGLLARITRRWFGEAAALVSCVLYLGYGPLLFYETKLMSETLGITLLLLAVYGLTSSRFARGEPATCVGTGALLSLATLARASLVPALPWFVLAPLFVWGSSEPCAGQPLRARVPRTGWLGLGMVLVLGLHGAWTQHHTGLFVPVILVSNTAQRAAQAGAWTGDLTIFASERGGEVSPWNVVNQARERIAGRRRGEPDPSALGGVDVRGFLAAAPSKALQTLADTERSYDYGYYGERSELSALRVASVSFGLLVALALLGVALRARARQLATLWPLVPIALGVLLTTTLFHPSTRYRLPLIVVLVPLASYALVQAPRLERWPSRVAALAYVAIAIAYFTSATLSYTLQYPAMWQLRVAEAAAVAGQRTEAEDRLTKAVRLARGDQRVLRRARHVAQMLRSVPTIRKR